MNSLQLRDGEVHARATIETKYTGFQTMNEEQMMGTSAAEREIYMQDDLLDDASILYADFPPLPDFPCMSSSSSSSSTPAAVKANNSSAGSSSSSSSASSAASWAVLRSDAEDVDKKNHEQQHQQYHNHQDRSIDEAPPALSSTASMDISREAAAAAAADTGINGSHCMDVMENFGFMDLLDDSNDLFDPSSIFNQDETPVEGFHHHQQQQQEQQRPPQNEHQHQELVMQRNNGDRNELDGASSDDLAMVFLEWLKSNKETVSAEDLRRVKIKKSTIESAAKRLGGGKDAMKQLLKLILEWVKTNHLQKRRMREPLLPASNNLPYQQYQDPFQNPNPNPNLNCTNPIPPEPNPCFAQSSWIGQPSYIPDPATVVTGFPPAVGFMGDSFANGTCNNLSGHGYAPPPPSEYHMLETAPSWPHSQFALASHYNSFGENNLHPAPPLHSQAFAGYGNQYPYPYLHGHGEQRLMRMGSSATKEARKKRMARQRRLSSHPRHHHQHHHHNQQNQFQNQTDDQHARFGSDTCNPAGAQGNPGNWVFWPSTPGGPAAVSAVLPVDRPPVQPQNYQRQTASDRRQGWKPEKNLRFLLQKVLKQSDVGNLGRIVLPKKEAETHLPELEARDGISIAMEDIGTSRIWNMRYRFWPNNKSRMYLLENTGDFVKANGLQEGDFIVIYSDVKCGKYLIRGVKVRQPEPKSETKRPGKSQRNQHATSPSAAPGNGGSSSSPIPQTVK